jgi:class 3 adenylate cyclase
MNGSPRNRESRLASVAFIHLPGLFEQGPAHCFDAIQELHFCLKHLRFPKGALVLSAFTGAIIVARDGVLHGARSAVHHFFKDIFAACIGLPLRIGVTHGTVEFFSDVEGGTYIGEPVNIAARLATAPENAGLLYEKDYCEFRRTAIDNDAFRPKADKEIRVKGKAHDEDGFVCFEAVNRFAAPKDFSNFRPLGHQASEVSAFIVAVDLPRFSSGARELLSKRFRAFVDAAEKLVSENEVKKLHYSPGGDGGVLVFPGVMPGHKAWMILDRLDKELASETLFQTKGASVESRIGAHYGLVQVYRNAQDREVPTGHTCFVTEQIAKDVAGGSIACSENLRKDGGTWFTPNPPTSPIGPVNVPGVGVVQRYLLKGELKPSEAQLGDGSDDRIEGRRPLPKLEAILDLLVRDQLSGQYISVSTDPSLLPIKRVDELLVRARVNQPAYLALAWVDQQGKPFPMHPWDWAKADWNESVMFEALTEIAVPNLSASADRSDLSVDGPAGIETLVLMANCGRPERETVKRLPGLLEYEPLRMRRLVLRRAVKSGYLKQTTAIRTRWPVKKQRTNPVRNIHEALGRRLTSHFDCVIAFSFSNAGK